MKLLDGYRQVKALDASDQRAFLQFEQQQRKQLLPYFMDFFQVAFVLGQLMNLLQMANILGGFDQIPVKYWGLALSILLIIANRWSSARYAYPRLIYLTSFAFYPMIYFEYIVFDNKEMDIIIVAFFISGLGLITHSVRHTLILIALNFAFLFTALYLISPDNLVQRFLNQSQQVFLVICCLTSPVTALLCKHLFRNLFAYQFLLERQNREIGESIRQLHATENSMIQQHKQRALSQMASGLLDNILEPVTQSSEAIGDARKHSSGDEDMQDVLDDADTNLERIHRIVRELQLFSQQDIDEDKSVVTVGELIQSALTHSQNRTDGIHIMQGGETDARVHCLPTMMSLVIVNLIKNSACALKARISSGDAQITIQANTVGDQVQISVSDNGSGIEAAQLHLVSEPFFSTKTEADRLGLGLSICQRIVSLHDGEMNIESVQGCGTTVLVRLPAYTSMASSNPIDSYSILREA